MASGTAALIEHYLREWDSSGWAAAYHSLIELGPPVLPQLQARFAESGDSRFRAALVELAFHLHSPDTLPLFATALRGPEARVWKAALDGLVDLASPAAAALLEEALGWTPPGRTNATDWTSWLDEALQQVREAIEAQGGIA
jgi:HEAT repeat protein